MYKRQDGDLKKIPNVDRLNENLNKVEQSTSNTNESCNGNVVLVKELINNNDVVEQQKYTKFVSVVYDLHFK